MLLGVRTHQIRVGFQDRLLEVASNIVLTDGGDKFVEEDNTDILTVWEALD